MKTTVRGALKVAFVLAGLYCSASSHASAIVSIDRFFVDVNGSAVFEDTFENDLTPSQETTYYNVRGAFPDGAESGGLLTLNSDWGNFGTNALGQPRQNLNTAVRGVLDVNIGTIDVVGIFNLATPTGPLNNGYGIRAYDLLQGQPTDRVLQIQVQYWEPTGMAEIRFMLQDFTNGTRTDLGSVPFTPGINDEQIALLISRPDAGNNEFFGAYAFGSGGNFGAPLSFATPGIMFTNTDSVGAAFYAFSAVPQGVPEPATLALLGLGLAGLAASHRRKQ